MNINAKKFLDKIASWTKGNYPLLIILLVAFAVRWYGIYFDYPYGVTSIGDEGVMMQYWMDIINSKSLSAGFSSYPVLMAFLYLPILILRILYLAWLHGLHNLAEIKNYIIVNGMGQIFIVARWYSVVIGTASVFLIYKIYGLIFKHKASHYYAALAYSFSLIPVMLAHWGRLHTSMTFFFLLALFFILRFEAEKKEKYWVGSLLAAALSLSCHYVGCMSFIFPLLGYLYNRNEVSFKTMAKSAAACLAIFFIAFGIDYRGIIFMFLSQYHGFLAPNKFTGFFPVGKIERFYYGLIDVFRLEPVFFTLFIATLIANFKNYYRNKLTRYILAGLLVGYCFLLAVAGAHLSRWLLIFITLSTTLAAGALSEYLLDRQINKKIVYLILALVLLPNIFFTTRWLMLFQGNTREEATEWIRENVKTNEFVYCFDNWFDAPLSYGAIAWDKQNNNRSSKKQDYFLEHPEVLKNISTINLVYDYNNGRYQKLAGDKTKYVLMGYWVSGDKPDYYEFPTRKDWHEILSKINEYHQLKLVKVFLPTSNQRLIASGTDDYFNSPHSWWDLLYLERGGPTVEIYQVEK